MIFTGDSVTLTTAAGPFMGADAPTTPADPAAVTLVVIDPAGNSTSYTYAAAQITKVGAGVYSKTVVCPMAGKWHARIIGAGGITKSDDVSWTVRAPFGQ